MQEHLFVYKYMHINYSLSTGKPSEMYRENGELECFAHAIVRPLFFIIISRSRLDRSLTKTIVNRQTERAGAYFSFYLNVFLHRCGIKQFSRCSTLFFMLKFVLFVSVCLKWINMLCKQTFIITHFMRDW